MTTPINTAYQGLSRTEILAKMKAHFAKQLALKGITEFNFTLKVKFPYQNRTIVSIIPSECQFKDGLYIAFTDSKNIPIPGGSLYFLPHNPHFKTEYPLRVHPQVGDTYAVNVDLLEEQILPALPEEAEGYVPNLNPNDENIKDMTITDYAAIHLGMPISGRPWLDEAIRKKFNS